MARQFLGNRKLNRGMGIIVALLVSSRRVSIEAQQTSVPPEVLAYPNMIAYKGRVLTVDEDFSTVQAFAVRNGKVVKVVL